MIRNRNTGCGKNRGQAALSHGRGGNGRAASISCSANARFAGGNPADLSALTSVERILATKFLDPDHPFFKPVWRRWATVAVPLAWCAVEFASGSPGWAVLFGAAGVYAFWVLIVKGPSA